jgi:hypothetical protein
MSTPVFNATEYIQKANEREQLSRDVKPAAASTEAAAAPAKPAEAEPTSEEKTEASARASRSQRRLLRQLGEAEGRTKVLEEMLHLTRPAAAATAKAENTEDPEPARDKFQDDASYNRALGRWEARQEATKTVAQALGQKEQIESLRDQVRAADAKAQEDKAIFDDWDQVQKDALEDGPEFNPAEHPVFMGLLATSDQKAKILYHFGKHADEFEKMLALSDAKNPGQQIRMFARLEGKVEKLYEKGEKKAEAASNKKTDDKKPTAAERDAKKAAPSESVAARGGSAPPNTVSPVLADGKTLNPQWKERANQREGRRA